MSAGVAKAVQRMQAAAFGNKLRWFESHYRHISLCSLGRRARLLTESVGNKLSWFESQYWQIFCVAEAVECSLRVALRN